MLKTYSRLLLSELEKLFSNSRTKLISKLFEEPLKECVPVNKNYRPNQVLAKTQWINVTFNSYSVS